MSVNDASNVNGSGFEILLEVTGDILIEQALKFEFKANNNQAEYKSVITDMVLVGLENSHKGGGELRDLEKCYSKLSKWSKSEVQGP